MALLSCTEVRGWFFSFSEEWGFCRYWCFRYVLMQRLHVCVNVLGVYSYMHVCVYVCISVCPDQHARGSLQR